jgi:hypothetical protein
VCLSSHHNARHTLETPTSGESLRRTAWIHRQSILALRDRYYVHYQPTTQGQGTPLAQCATQGQGTPLAQCATQEEALVPNSRVVQTEEEINVTFLSLITSMRTLVDLFNVLPTQSLPPESASDFDSPEEFEHSQEFRRERRYALEQAAQLHNELATLYNENWQEVRQYIEL